MVRHTVTGANLVTYIGTYQVCKEFLLRDLFRLVPSASTRRTGSEGADRQYWKGESAIRVGIDVSNTADWHAVSFIMSDGKDAVCHSRMRTLLYQPNYLL